MVFLYLLERLVKRVRVFLSNWYVRGTKRYFEFLVETLRRLDKTFAWKITLKMLFKPLYKDYSLEGYIIGFVLRFLRLIFSSALYLIISVAIFFVYILWLFLPFYLFFSFLGLIHG